MATLYTCEAPVITPTGEIQCAVWMALDSESLKGSLLPNLSIEDSLVISASIIGLLAIGYGFKVIGRFIQTF